MANNVLKLAREELKYALSNNIQQALKGSEVIVVENIPLKVDKQSHLISIKATAVKEADLQALILIVFEDHGPVKPNNKSKNHHAAGDNAAAEELKKELVYTKQQLTTTVEEMESSLERLRLSNEELQSTNEELQSTNEESLTTKEEMQSLNEELMTVNTQYQSKAEELPG